MVLKAHNYCGRYFQPGNVTLSGIPLEEEILLFCSDYLPGSVFEKKHFVVRRSKDSMSVSVGNGTTFSTVPCQKTLESGAKNYSFLLDEKNVRLTQGLELTVSLDGKSHTLLGYHTNPLEAQFSSYVVHMLPDLGICLKHIDDKVVISNWPSSKPLSMVAQEGDQFYLLTPEKDRNCRTHERACDEVCAAMVGKFALYRGNGSNFELLGFHHDVSRDVPRFARFLFFDTDADVFFDAPLTPPLPAKLLKNYRTRLELEVFAPEDIVLL